MTEVKVYADDLTSMIYELALDINDARAYFDTMNPATLETEKARLNLLKNVMQYEGFNPRKMHSMLYKKHSDMAQNIKASPDALELVSGEVMDRDLGRSVLVYTNNEDFYDDIKFICWMFITDKTPFDIKNKNKKLMVEIMNILEHKYDINTATRKPGVSLDSETITVPRIVACMPMMTVNLFHQGYGQTIFDPSKIFRELKIPRAMFAPTVAFCIPSNLKVFQPILFAVSVATDCVLHPEGHRTKLKQLAQFLKVSLSSKVVTELYKKEVCKHWGLLLKNNEPAPFVESARLKALRYVRRARVDDLDLEQVLASM